MTDVFIRDSKGEGTNTKMKTEAESGVMQPPSREISRVTRSQKIQGKKFCPRTDTS